jgi:hypothetical protein
MRPVFGRFRGESERFDPVPVVSPRLCPDQLDANLGRTAIAVKWDKQKWSENSTQLPQSDIGIQEPVASFARLLIPDPQNVERKRFELSTSAMRMQRSPS